MHTGEDVGKEKSSFPAGRSEGWCTHCGNQYGGVSKAGNIGTRGGAEVKKPLILLQRARGDSQHPHGVSNWCNSSSWVFDSLLWSLGGTASMWCTHVGKQSHT